MLLGTSGTNNTTLRCTFQSPERIHAFGNGLPTIAHCKVSGFNPQRGFMLLGTPEKIICRYDQTGFNPQRGFMLLGTNC